MFLSRFRSLGVVALGFALGLAHAAPTHAQWFTHANDPDVFGNTTVVTGAMDDSGNGIVVQCDHQNLYVAFVSPVTSSKMDDLSTVSSGIPSIIYLKVGQQLVRKFDAKLRQWNNTMAGVVATGPTPAMNTAIKDCKLDTASTRPAQQPNQP